MLKKLFQSSFYAFITFCVISYFSVMASLMKSIGNLAMKPVSNIGFPYKYYYQFWLKGMDSPNCGWNINNFFIDIILTWVLVTSIYFIVAKTSE